MAEYIDRKAVIENLDILMNKSELGYVIGQAVKRYIKRQPFADVAPVRHGRWKCFGRNLGECSECGEVVASRYNYCPNCGAKMDTEVQE